MATRPYIVTFNLMPDASGRSPVAVKIENDYSNAKKITETSYLVASDQDPGTIYDDLKGALGTQHMIYIIGLHCPYFGYGPSDLNQWVTDNVEWN
jgi:hypothetical protein